MMLGRVVDGAQPSQRAMSEKVTSKGERRGETISRWGFD